MNAWLAMLLVFVLFGVLMGGLLALRSWARLHEEFSRKLIHMGMGVVTLSFPWLFSKPWPVFVLSGFFFLLLLALKLYSPLRQRYGKVISGVERRSHGDLYFPLAVGLLFYISHGDRLFYCVPILILTFADALSALVGIHYGQTRYTTDDGYKSVEGSAVFFIVAFLSVLVPLLVFTQIGRVEVVLVALCIALLSMMVEASAWRGMDNLFIPLAALVILKTNLSLDVTALGVRLTVAVLLFAGMIFWRGRTTLKDSALLGAALGCYYCWASGGWPWLVPPLILIASYTLFSPRHQRNTERVHDNQAVIAVASAGLVWLFLAKTFERPDFYFPFTLTFAAHLAIIGIIRWKRASPYLPGIIFVTASSLISWLLMFVPYLLIEKSEGRFVGNAVIALGGIIGAATVFYFIQPGMHDCPNNFPRWVRQASLAAFASLAGVILVYLS